MLKTVILALVQASMHCQRSNTTQLCPFVILYAGTYGSRN